jgi:hypothetical protein
VVDGVGGGGDDDDGGSDVWIDALVWLAVNREFQVVLLASAHGDNLEPMTDHIPKVTKREGEREREGRERGNSAQANVSLWFSLCAHRTPHTRR